MQASNIPSITTAVLHLLGAMHRVNPPLPGGFTGGFALTAPISSQEAACNTLRKMCRAAFEQATQGWSEQDREELLVEEAERIEGTDIAAARRYFRVSRIGSRFILPRAVRPVVFGLLTSR